MTSIFEGQPPQNKVNPPTKTRGPIWVPGTICFIKMLLGQMFAPVGLIGSPMEVQLHLQRLSHFGHHGDPPGSVLVATNVPTNGKMFPEAPYER